MSIAGILTALKSGPKSTTELHQVLGIRGGAIARDCSILIKRGEVVRIDGGSGRGKRAVYALAGSSVHRQQRPTGAQLVEAIQHRAAELGLSLATFAAPLNANPDAWLRGVALAQQPRDGTIARIEALLAASATAQVPAQLPPTATGADLYDRIIARAAQLGLEPNDFIRPLTGGKHCATWLGELRSAARPRPYTVDRIEALLAGGAIPESPHALKRRAAVATRRDNPSFVNVAGSRERIVNPPAPVDRDPCFMCGTRADIGCRHQRPYA